MQCLKMNPECCSLRDRIDELESEVVFLGGLVGWRTIRSNAMELCRIGANAADLADVKGVQKRTVGDALRQAAKMISEITIPEVKKNG